jgi:hypothetical protein
MSGSGSRASIPTGVRKTIQNIKEITGNHSDDEIYAMLKECSMDPNETAQKLLFQGTFISFCSYFFRLFRSWSFLNFVFLIVFLSGFCLVFESLSVELGFWGFKWGPFGMKFCLAKFRLFFFNTPFDFFEVLCCLTDRKFRFFYLFYFWWSFVVLSLGFSTVDEVLLC